MGRQFYERQDIMDDIRRLEKTIRAGDEWFTLKYTNRLWNGPSDAHKTVQAYMRQIIDRMLSYEEVTQVVWGRDVFETEFPHINCIMSFRDDTEEFERRMIVRSIKYHWDWIMLGTTKIDKWKSVEHHTLKDEGTQWTPQWGEKACSLYHAMKYIYKRATQRATRAWTMKIGVVIRETRVIREAILIYPHRKENGVEVLLNTK